MPNSFHGFCLNSITFSISENVEFSDNLFERSSVVNVPPRSVLLLISTSDFNGRKTSKALKCFVNFSTRSKANQISFNLMSNHSHLPTNSGSILYFFEISSLEKFVLCIKKSKRIVFNSFTESLFGCFSSTSTGWIMFSDRTVGSLGSGLFGFGGAVGFYRNKDEVVIFRYSLCNYWILPSFLKWRKHSSVCYWNLNRFRWIWSFLHCWEHISDALRWKQMVQFEWFGK